ncbi:hypothetical protein [Sinanaerobacter sp. ZZT-01]|uniref:hypothetical protein n=1 Tax=Sinanaerobacter sp. ZZT-01 TaxID=3111540 RepID=UPI002D799023|nr:hypothetical protein [Sinanaerobacter sp. ZZT-01]WRR93361.1 hypothetical protein U5921_15230 [Sinanaerobacter sp. ZZT-01]
MLLAMEGMFEEAPILKKWSICGKDKALLLGIMQIEGENPNEPVRIKVVASDEVAKQIESLPIEVGKKVQFIAEVNDAQSDEFSLRICGIDPTNTVVEKQDKLLKNFMER